VPDPPRGRREVHPTRRRVAGDLGQVRSGRQRNDRPVRDVPHVEDPVTGAGDAARDLDRAVEPHAAAVDAHVVVGVHRPEDLVHVAEADAGALAVRVVRVLGEGLLCQLASPHDHRAALVGDDREDAPEDAVLAGRGAGGADVDALRDVGDRVPARVLDRLTGEQRHVPGVGKERGRAVQGGAPELDAGIGRVAHVLLALLPLRDQVGAAREEDRAGGQRRHGDRDQHDHHQGHAPLVRSGNRVHDASPLRASGLRPSSRASTPAACSRGPSPDRRTCCRPAAPYR
jgi:hypothetical protein